MDEPERYNPILFGTFEDGSFSPKALQAKYKLILSREDVPPNILAAYRGTELLGSSTKLLGSVLDILESHLHSEFIAGKMSDISITVAFRQGEKCGGRYELNRFFLTSRPFATENSASRRFLRRNGRQIRIVSRTERRSTCMLGPWMRDCNGESNATAGTRRVKGFSRG